jgi:hypothetical protein
MEGSHAGKWAVIDDFVPMGGRIFVTTASPCVPSIQADMHGAGHEGIQKMLHRAHANFFIPRACTLVQDYVYTCATSHKNKIEQLHPIDLLQQLELSSVVWADIAIDFIEGFPKVHRKLVMLTVVDRFSKYAHFIPIRHPYTMTMMAHSFFTEIVRLHGLPSSIVSDRGITFTSSFWKELFHVSGVRLNMLTAFHP